MLGSLYNRDWSLREKWNIIKKKKIRKPCVFVALFLSYIRIIEIERISRTSWPRFPLCACTCLDSLYLIYIIKLCTDILWPFGSSYLSHIYYCHPSAVFFPKFLFMIFPAIFLPSYFVHKFGTCIFLCFHCDWGGGRERHQKTFLFLLFTFSFRSTICKSKT